MGSVPGANSVPLCYEATDYLIALRKGGRVDRLSHDDRCTMWGQRRVRRRSVMFKVRMAYWCPECGHDGRVELRVEQDITNEVFDCSVCECQLQIQVKSV